MIRSDNNLKSPTSESHSAASNVFAKRPIWLVSVKDLAEFGDASQIGVDIIDLKDPDSGPLAAATKEVWTEIAGLCRKMDTTNRPLISVALGERQQAESVVGELPTEFTYAKAGPSGCRSSEELIALWERLRKQLRPQTELVAVAYADFNEANCLNPFDVLQAAKRIGLQKILIDTFVKDGRSCTEKLTQGELLQFDRDCKASNFWWALAGQIRLADLPPLAAAEIQPDCLAVRGDVCDTSRTGKLSKQRLEMWRQTIESLRETNQVT